jgi:hypothetical protein
MYIISGQIAHTIINVEERIPKYWGSIYLVIYIQFKIFKILNTTDIKFIHIECCQRYDYSGVRVLWMEAGVPVPEDIAPESPGNPGRLTSGTW